MGTEGIWASSIASLHFAVILKLLYKNKVLIKTSRCNSCQQTKGKPYDHFIVSLYVKTAEQISERNLSALENR